MIAPLIVPVIRRAILDLLADIGGERNHDVIAMELNQLGHSVSRRDVAEQMAWLGEAGLLHCEQLGPFHVARILADGRDVAAGTLTVDGVSPHKTGE